MIKFMEWLNQPGHLILFLIVVSFVGWAIEDIVKAARGK